MHVIVYSQQHYVFGLVKIDLYFFSLYLDLFPVTNQLHLQHTELLTSLHHFTSWIFSEKSFMFSFMFLIPCSLSGFSHMIV